MPYAPGTQYRGDQYIFQGGRDTATALSGWLENFLNQQKQVNAAGKSADFFVKANPDALNEMGVHPDEWKNLGAREKASAVQGYVQGKSAQQQAQQIQAQTQLRQSEAAKAQMDADSAQGMPQFAQFLNELQSNAPAGQPMSQTVMQALAKVQSLNPRVAAAIAAKVLPGVLQNADDGGPVNFTEDPVTGARFASKGKVVTPSGFNPSKTMAGGAVPLTGEDGSIIGYNIPVGKGNYKPTMMKDLSESDKQKLISQHMKEQDTLLGQLPLANGNTNTINAINDRIAMHQDAIQTLKGGAKKNVPTTDNTPPQKVTTKTQFDALPSGAVYSGTDGKQYRKP